MKGMLVVRVAGLVLVISQLSGCAWWSGLFSPRQSEVAYRGPSPTPGPRPGPGLDPGPKPQPELNPDPELLPKPDPQPKPQPPKENVPTARLVPGRPGFVFSPFNNKLIDVEGIASGRLVSDPHYSAEEKKYFRVP